MFKIFNDDLKRYVGKGTPSIYLLFEQGLWAIAVYRFGRYVKKMRLPIVSFIFRFIAFLLFKFIEVLTGISIPASAQIGKGLYVGHFGGIIIHSDAVIGENCSLGPGVLIGTKGLGNTGTPTIGNNVYIGVGAKILGKITIGNNVRIGANAVVIHDAPDNATLVGIPARIVSVK